MKKPTKQPKAVKAWGVRFSNTGRITNIYTKRCLAQEDWLIVTYDKGEIVPGIFTPLAPKKKRKA